MPDPVFLPIDMNGILRAMPPTVPSIPMVFDSPHSGLVIPPFERAVSDELVRVASDTHVDELFDFAPSIGAPFLIAHFPRSFLDLNRSVMDIDLEMIEGHWPHPVRDSASARRGMGLVWRYAWGDTPMYARKLTVSEMADRIDTYWRPYHDTLVSLLDQTHAAHGKVYHINCHSMPAVGHALSPDPTGTVRKDIVIGDYDGQACEPDFVNLVIETLRGFGYTVSLNIPFRGAELVSAYSLPGKARHSIQIELNRKLYMDEATRDKTKNFTVVKQDLERLGQVMSEYVSQDGQR